MESLVRPAQVTSPLASQYRSDIDGLRAIAVTAVVAYHAGIPGFSGGFVGVDVFFVISGFLITKILAAESARTGTISLRQFYAKRVRRLMPALLFTVLTTLVVWTVFFSGRGDMWKFARSVRWSLLGLANFFFKKNTGGYFDGPTAEMPLLHLWSLAVEEQFYLVWPLLILLSGVGLARKRWNNRVTLVGVFSIVTVVSFLGAEYLVRHGKSSSAFYDMPNRAWELGLGGLLGFIPALSQMGWSRIDRWKTKSHFLSVLGLGLIFYPIIGYTGHTAFPGLSALPPVLGTLCLLYAGSSSSENFVSKILSSRAFVKVGILSYGWYLWHWPLLSMAKVWNFGAEVPLALNICLSVLALGFSEVSHRFIENPIRHSEKAKRANPFKVIGAGFVVSAGIFFLALVAPKLEIQMLSARYGQQFIRQVFEKPALGIDCFEEGAISTPYCNFAFIGKNSDTTRKPDVSSIAIWGDSHACSYFPMAVDLAKKSGLKLSKYCQGNTPPLMPEPPSGMNGMVLEELKKKVSAGESTSVILAARWKKYAGSEAANQNLRASLTRTLKAMSDLGIKRVLVILPYIDFPVPVIECLVKNISFCGKPRETVEKDRMNEVTILREVIAPFPNVRLLDPLPKVCSAENCLQNFNGMATVMDDNHVTAEAARKIGRESPGEMHWLIGL